ncbi:MAG TPA: hypothetical protein VH815_13755 [Acidobacteriota bacterium]
MKKVRKVKNHVWKNRGRYSAATTLVVVTYVGWKLGERNRNFLNAFLEEHDLLTEYYVAAEDLI